MADEKRLDEMMVAVAGVLERLNANTSEALLGARLGTETIQ